MLRYAMRLQGFVPIFRNPHALTIAGNFWPRNLDERQYPSQATYFRTEPGVTVLVHSNRPPEPPSGEVIVVHGLEGCSDSGYMKSMAAAAVAAGFAAHRFNLRSCGGTERLCTTVYHAGLTADLLAFVRSRAAEAGPVFLVGFSVGANVVLKLAGELGAEAPSLIAGVGAVSAPLDLAACVTKMRERQNRVYEIRFVRRLKARMRAKHLHTPKQFPLDGLDAVRTLQEFDEKFTARQAGFRSAGHYYSECSAARFLDSIRVPTMLIQAKDDPIIPFEVYERTGLFRNPWLCPVVVEHGGHLGFLSRRAPRFWADCRIVDWFLGLRNKSQSTIVI